MLINSGQIRSETNFVTIQLHSMYRRRATVELNKPFQPLVINRPVSRDNIAGKNEGETGAKRVLTKRAPPVEEDSVKKIKIEPQQLAPKVSLPGQQFRILNVKTATPPSSAGEPDRYFEVLWRKASGKKNKTWDGDGTVVIENSKLATLQDMDGKQIVKSRLKSGALEEGELLRLGFYEIELGSPISSEKYLSGSSFIQTKPISKADVLAPKLFSSTFQAPSLLNSAGWKSGTLKRSTVITGPRHDPKVEGAVVMTRPKFSGDKEVLDVVIDPLLSQHLRPHQKEGVKFLYECVMGFKEYQGRGAILADEMGLGKTLMTITLLWTLLKQNPFLNEPPAIKRALIVCPVTLISNWKKEFRKWLGHDRIGVFTLDTKTNLNDFVAGRCYQVMIVGYEKLRTISADLQKASIDIIICDEGHRLKTSTNKSAQAILTLQTDRRVILSGTPIQNDLGEFFTMVDFLNPGILGTYSNFKREFEIPIMKSRQPEAMKKDIEKGTKRSEELSRLTRLFTLRRTAATLDKYLPPKTDTVLFCKPTSQQVVLYKALLESSMIRSCLGSLDPSDHLRAITLLKKLCNSPALIKDAEFDNSKIKVPPLIAMTSGKLKVLEGFLQKLYQDSEEKVVIVSGFTQTLDIIEEKLREMNLPCSRLDGSTPAVKRQPMVDKFNKSAQKQEFAFLLSAKSGGTGLNLIGASRLFLFDTDWNPSVDLQAMARVHRDGQKRPVFIYRLLTTGAMDEKIYQRQITKQGLADTFMDGGAASTSSRPQSAGQRLLSVSRDMKPNGGTSNTFSQSELQDLFSLNTETSSNTHDLLACNCHDIQGSQTVDLSQCSQNQTQTGRTCSIVNEIESEPEEDQSDGEGLGGWVTARNVVEGNVPIPKRLRKREQMKGLFEYKHIDPSSCHDEFVTGDAILDQLMQEKTPISFIFTRSTIEPSIDQ